MQFRFDKKIYLIVFFMMGCQSGWNRKSCKELDIAVLNYITIKVHWVFLSYNVVRVSSHYLRFYHHINARQLSNRSIFHAGRYLDDKEICYLGTVIVTANVYLKIIL